MTGTPKVKLIDVYAVPYREELLYKLLKERDSTSNISHSKMPGMGDHVRFIESKPYALWFFIVVDAVVGAMYLTHNNEIGIQILKEHRRKRYAIAAIKKFVEEITPLPGIPSVRAKEFCANIAPHNEPAKALFEKSGFTIRQWTYHLHNVENHKDT